MVVFPESGWEMMARLRRRVISGRRVWVEGDDDWSVVEDWRWVRGVWGRLRVGWSGVKAWMLLVAQSMDERDIVTASALWTRLYRRSTIFVVICTFRVQ